jgi:glycosyltransferase involved in cell wall biosynthesis
MTSATREAPAARAEGRCGPLRVAFVLSGLGRVQRGAEAAFLEVARCLAATPGVEVALFGSGTYALPPAARAEVVACTPRERFERWPCLPTLRGEGAYEELSYVWNLHRSGRYRPADHDVVVHCTFPWVNWYVRRAGRAGHRPLAVYVTQNGDWPCQAVNREFRRFGCDGLVCTNPEYYERNRGRYPSVLIPNGVDPGRYVPRGEAGSSAAEGDDPAGPGASDEIGGRPVVLIASAQIPSKDVVGGVEIASRVPNAFLLIAGDGPERDRVASAARELLPGRHRILGSVPRERMPSLFRRADAFLHVSRDEPSALVYLEAAASGLPMVVHDRDVTRWTLGPAAEYADTSDRDAAATALRRVLEPSRGAELGSLARRRVLEGWSWDVLAARYLDFFRTLGASQQ